MLTLRHRTGPRALLAALLVSLAALPAKAAEDRRGEILETMARQLEARYLDEAKGRQLGTMLRQAVQDGRFAAIAEPEAYAKALTEAMQASVPDLHLRLSYEPDREFAADAIGDRMVRRQDDSGATRQVVRTMRIDGRSAEQIARTNFGVDRVEHLDGNIG